MPDIVKIQNGRTVAHVAVGTFLARSFNVKDIDEVLSNCEIVWPSACWEWQKAPYDFDYGKVWFDGTEHIVHRIVYAALVGPIPDGMHLHHICRNKKCCNPAHLEPKTPEEHLLTGDTEVTRNKAKTHCKSGHAFDEKNTYWYQGRRQCYACTLNRARKVATRKRKTENPCNKDKTHCVRGHPLSGENLYVNPNSGNRICRECRRISQRARVRRKKAEEP